MTKFMLTTGAVAALALAGCATTNAPRTATATQTTEAAAPASVKTAIADPDAMECKKIAISGTRVKKKICKTNAEWEREREISQRSAGEFQRKGAQSGTKPVGGG